MKWKKLGRIFDTALLPEWAISHAQVPTPIVLKDRVRVFFAARNKNGKSFPIYADYDLNNLTKMIGFEQKPVLDLGDPGTFDDEGVMPAYAMHNGDNIWLYYSGWNQKIRTPYHNSTGIAVSKNGADFKRLYLGPIMDRTKEEPYLAVTPCIIQDGELWKMWYISGLKWVEIAGKYEPVYTIKYAESIDGIDWKRFPELPIKHHSEDEVFSHPSVVKISNRYHMWLCYRKIYDYRDGTNSYQIGYAHSDDGKNWLRNDELSGIEKSQEGWDSKMICYPYVIKIHSEYYMFYNGNYFGSTGFGLSILEK